MSLNQLPPEVLSRVCRFIGLFIKHGEPSYNNEDFQALRLTCRELKSKTDYDVGARYAIQLDDYAFQLSYTSLCDLLRIVKNPFLCDFIVTLHFRPLVSADWTGADRSYTDSPAWDRTRGSQGFRWFERYRSYSCRMFSTSCGGKTACGGRDLGRTNNSGSGR
jgi:hypothetical protein